ncbi:MAG: hypothetical protein A2Y20_04925 [Firmicutes bacterium GWF2_51_9]|nr:MAG: hypothetical protein A2Y20_04925 [Firmicutes bacterium GWF2_51_9]OGS57498.1 MAG: hypothetical protein A2Y19_02770 [Firmicutes bacterium GWE2_51_13]
MKFDEIINESGNLIVGTKLIVDCIYEEKENSHNMSGSILDKLMKVKNQGGFRYRGKINPFDIKYVVLFTTYEDKYWQDKFDEEIGVFIYYGDNKSPGCDLHGTNLHGNEILRDSFFYASQNNVLDRRKVPPFFVFEKTTGKNVKFLGLAAPGNNFMDQRDWLVAVWGARSSGGRFQNYKSHFTFLNPQEGSLFELNSSKIDTRWLDDIIEGKGYESVYCPIAWRNFIEKKRYTSFNIIREKKTKTKVMQLPKKDSAQFEMLNTIYSHFCQDPQKFEEFAIYIALLLDRNIVKLDGTRYTKDGGRDGIGKYRVCGESEGAINFDFVLEAKCYKANSFNETTSVGVKETSRLISRIKNRQFGIFVTTTFINEQAYSEIVEDEHPIIVVSGGDIVRLLKEKGIDNKSDLIKMLGTEFDVSKREV